MEHAISKSSMLSLPLETFAAQARCIQERSDLLQAAFAELGRVCAEEDHSACNSVVLAMHRRSSCFAAQFVDACVEIGTAVHDKIALVLPSFESMIEAKDVEALKAEVVNKTANIALPSLLAKLTSFKKLMSGLGTDRWPRSAILPFKSSSFAEMVDIASKDAERIKLYIGIATVSASLFVTIPSLKTNQDPAPLKAEVKARLVKQDFLMKSRVVGRHAGGQGL